MESNLQLSQRLGLIQPSPTYQLDLRDKPRPDSEQIIAIPAHGSGAESVRPNGRRFPRVGSNPNLVAEPVHRCPRVTVSEIVEIHEPVNGREVAEAIHLAYQVGKGVPHFRTL